HGGAGGQSDDQDHQHRGAVAAGDPRALDGALSAGPAHRTAARSALVRVAWFVGPAALGVVAAAAASAGALVEPADIADDLFEEGQFSPGGRCRAGCRLDFLPVLQIPVVDRPDHATLVEIDDVDLLVDDVGIEERDLLCPPADVV